MSIKRKRVLVTGARAPVTLHLCRILNEAGHDVYAADSVPYALTKASNAIKAFFLVPAPKFDTHAYVASLINILKTHQIDLLIPTCEESFYISMHKERLSSYCDVFTADFDQMKQLHHKGEFIQYARRLGFQTPKTAMLVPQMNQEAAWAFFGEEIVLKKIYSRFSEGVEFVQKQNYEPSRYAAGEWIVQERIKGTQYCAYGIARNGALLAFSAYETVFTAGAGASVSFRHTERTELEQFTEAVVKDLQFTGQISFDFMVDAHNRAIPIECNPRATSGLHLFGQEVAACFFAYEGERTYPDMHTQEMIMPAMIACLPGWRKAKRPAAVWLRTMATHQDITFRKDDLKPFFYQFMSLYALWRESRKHGVTILGQSTYDMSWDGDRR